MPAHNVDRDGSPVGSNRLTFQSWPYCFAERNTAPTCCQDRKTRRRCSAQYDKPGSGGNGDGVIDSRDKVFTRLRLWRDLNHDSISQPNELFTLAQLGIASIDLNYQEHKWVDAYGNQFRYRAKVTFVGESQGGQGHWAYDVVLLTSK